jgi:hypothetical protein
MQGWISFRVTSGGSSGLGVVGEQGVAGRPDGDFGGELGDRVGGGGGVGEYKVDIEIED